MSSIIVRQPALALHNKCTRVAPHNFLSFSVCGRRALNKEIFFLSRDDDWDEFVFWFRFWCKARPENGGKWQVKVQVRVPDDRVWVNESEAKECDKVKECYEARWDKEETSESVIRKRLFWRTKTNDKEFKFCEQKSQPTLSSRVMTMNKNGTDSNLKFGSR